MKRAIPKVPLPSPKPIDASVTVYSDRLTMLCPHPEDLQQALFRSMRLPAKHGKVLQGYTTTAFAVTSLPDRPLVLVLHPPGLFSDGESLISAVIQKLPDGDAGQ